MIDHDLDQLRTRDEIARALGNVTANAILKATQRGEIAFFPIGRRHLYRLRDVTAWLDAKQVKPTASLGRIQATATPGSRARRSRVSV